MIYSRARLLCHFPFIIFEMSTPLQKYMENVNENIHNMCQEDKNVPRKNVAILKILNVAVTNEYECPLHTQENP